MWSFNVSTATQFLEQASQMDLSEVIRNVKCDVFVGDADPEPVPPGIVGVPVLGVPKSLDLDSDRLSIP